MIKTKEIEDFVKELKNTEENNCANCILSAYDQDIKKRKYSILNNLRYD